MRTVAIVGGTLALLLIGVLILFLWLANAAFPEENISPPASGMPATTARNRA